MNVCSCPTRFTGGAFFGCQRLFCSLIYSKRQIYLPFTMALRGMHTIFVWKILRLHAGKIGAGKTKREKFMTFPISQIKKWDFMECDVLYMIEAPKIV